MMMLEIPRAPGSIPFLTTGQMREVDRAMVEDFQIGLIQMMENAGRSLARLVRCHFLDGNPRGASITVLAGSGGNGGGALVAARHLSNYGARVQVVLSGDPDKMTGVPRHQLEILKRMGIRPATVENVADRARPDLIVDGLIGYSLRGTPRGNVATLIRWANASPAPVVSLDTPSGLDTATGAVHEPAVVASATMTLALPKAGLRSPAASGVVGELFLADIGVPPELYGGSGLNYDVGPLFAESDLLRIDLPRER